MDKAEYRIATEHIKKLISQGEYAEASHIADTIDWTRVRSVMMLCTISDLYKINRRYEDAKELLYIAYERNPESRTILYSLCDLSIKLEEFVAAIEYYKSFVEVAPRDTGRYVLQYRLYQAQDVSLEERIDVLEQLKSEEYVEKWAYELAYLYHRIGFATKCVEECDELILWFGQGRYVYKAMELKMLHEPLTPSQQRTYDNRFEHLEQAKDMTRVLPRIDSGDSEMTDESMVDVTDAPTIEIPKEFIEKEIENKAEEIQVKTLDVANIYNTMNLQKELADSLREILDVPSVNTLTKQETEQDVLANTRVLERQQVEAVLEAEAMEEVIEEEAEAEITEEVIEEEPEAEITEEVIEEEPEAEITEEVVEEEPEAEITEEVVEEEPEAEITEEVVEDEPEKIIIKQVADPAEYIIKEQITGQMSIEDILQGLSEEELLTTESEEEVFEAEDVEEAAEKEEIFEAVEKPDFKEPVEEPVAETIKSEETPVVLQQNLYEMFIRADETARQIEDARKHVSLEPCINNVAVTGHDLSICFEFIKVFMMDLKQQGNVTYAKTAKISAVNLNKKEPSEIVAKLQDGILIIERAGRLRKETVTKLEQCIKEIPSILVIMTDTAQGMDRFSERYHSLSDMFNLRVDIKDYTGEELIKFAAQYAYECEYSIDTMGLLALQTRIEEMISNDDSPTMEDAKIIVDEAIHHANRKNFKHFMDILLRKRYDDEDMIILREEDFF